MANFRKLRLWQLARELAIDAHRVAARTRGATSTALRDHDLEMMTEQDFTALLARVIDVRKVLHGPLKRVKATGNG